jgi:glycosyltransferase involved in cell wall biosynthesis
VRVDRVLIAASNLHVGGGVQAAASFIDELHLLRGREAAPWLAHVDVEVSSLVWGSLGEATREDLPITVVDTRPYGLANWRPRRRSHDVSFTVFGPEWRLPRARRRIVGYADVRSLYRSHPAEGLSRRRRMWWSARGVASRMMMRRVDVIVVETPALAARLAAKGVVPRDRVDVVSNSFSRVFDHPDQWQPVPTPDPEPGTITLAYVARGYPHKNLGFLPALAAAAAGRGVAVRFLLTLSDAEWASASPALRACSTNVGTIPIQAVPSIYAAADAAIFPSLLEGFSAMPLEAMKQGLVVFASRRDFVSSVCRDAPAYIDPEDPVDAARTVIRVLGDPEEVRLHVKRGHEVVADLPTAADRAARYVEIIDSLVRES